MKIYSDKRTYLLVISLWLCIGIFCPPIILLYGPACIVWAYFYRPNSILLEILPSGLIIKKLIKDKKINWTNIRFIKLDNVRRRRPARLLIDFSADNEIKLRREWILLGTVSDKERVALACEIKKYVPIKIDPQVFSENSKSNSGLKISILVIIIAKLICYCYDISTF